jgi:hypothetical protein
MKFKKDIKVYIQKTKKAIQKFPIIIAEREDGNIISIFWRQSRVTKKIAIIDQE